jgi:hypothetical protein
MSNTAPRETTDRNQRVRNWKRWVMLEVMESEEIMETPKQLKDKAPNFAVTAFTNCWN